MIKYRLHATIGLPEYSNLQPEIELEGENIDELHATAMAHISEVWAKYGKSPLKGATGQIEGNQETLDELTTFTGEQIKYNVKTHEYFDLNGVKLMSGSAYASIGEKPFDKAMLLPKTAKSWGVEEKDLGDIWDINGRISNEYGSAVHSALELFLKYHGIGAKIQEKKEMGHNYAMTKIAHLNSVIDQFWTLYGSELEHSMGEVLVSDVANRMAGRIDLLHILDKDKKVCRIGDYKTNHDLDDKKIAKYQKQLSFYGNILKNKGWTVEGVDLYHYSDHWDKVVLELLDMEAF